MIYTVTLNPAIDNIIKTKEILTRGKNNRIQEKYLDVGGKGTHVSVGLTLLGQKNICTGITGEKRNQDLADLLQTYGTESLFYTITNQEVRNNYILTDESGKGSFMITDYGFPLKKEQIDHFFSERLSELKEEDTVVISGNPCMHTDITVFSYFLDKLEERKVRLVADVSGEFLTEILKREVFLIKPNQHEFSEIVNENLTTLEDCIAAYWKNKSLLKNVKNISVSMGGTGSVFLTDKESYIFEPPFVDTVNDTGSGDAFVSGLVYGLVNALSVKEIGILATAIGAAKAEEEKSTGFNIQRVEELKEQVVYRKIGE